MSMIKNSLLFLSVLQMSHTCGIHRYTYNKCAGYNTLFKINCWFSDSSHKNKIENKLSDKKYTLEHEYERSYRRYP